MPSQDPERPEIPKEPSFISKILMGFACSIIVAVVLNLFFVKKFILWVLVLLLATYHYECFPRPKVTDRVHSYIKHMKGQAHAAPTRHP